MPIKPIPPQHRLVHIPCPANPPHTLCRLAKAIKRLSHDPLSTGIEEGQLVSDLESARPVTDANLPAGHVKDQTGGAAMVDVDEVAVELNVQVARGLHGRVGHGGGRGVRDACKEGAWPEPDERDGPAGKGARVVFYAEETAEVWLHPGGDLRRGSIGQLGRGGVLSRGGRGRGAGFAICVGCWYGRRGNGRGRHGVSFEVLPSSSSSSSSLFKIRVNSRSNNARCFSICILWGGIRKAVS